MTTSGLYPEPPHLSVFVYAASTAHAVWTECAGVLQANGCVPTGQALVAEASVGFKSISDIERSVIARDGMDLSVPAGQVLLRVGYEHRAYGRISLGLAPIATLGPIHPIEVAVHAGPFSYPVGLWTKDQRREAKRLTAWTERLLLTLARATGAPYGAIGIEAVFPEPDELAHAAAERILRPTTWFWSHSLGAAHPYEQSHLLSRIPGDRLRRADAGHVLRGWRPGDAADNESIDNVLKFLDSIGIGPSGTIP